MSISDMIADTIIQMLEIDEIVEIKRNDFAEQVGCVPSQINYVLTSRFKPEHGFLVESKRGGGGFIKIKRMNSDTNDRQTYIMHIIENIGDSIDTVSSEIILKNIYNHELITVKEAKIALQGVSNNSLRFVDSKVRDYVRADILKNMLLVYITI